MRQKDNNKYCDRGTTTNSKTERERKPQTVQQGMKYIRNLSKNKVDK